MSYKDYINEGKTDPLMIVTWNRQQESKFKTVKKIKYKGSTITVVKGPSGYVATNDYGEDYMEVPVFKDEKSAIAWDKKNMDMNVG